MSGMKYRWERLLADPECKAALEKILGCGAEHGVRPLPVKSRD
jgi:hypothetical protein